MESGQALVGSLHGSDGRERRCAPRCQTNDAVSCTVRESSTACWQPAAILDISTTGISLLTDQQFDLGQLLNIELRHDNSGLLRSYSVEVCHDDICFPNDDWLHGCRFVRPLGDGELQLWL